MRRALFWTAVAVALTALGTGVVVTLARYRAHADPSAVLRAYFAALAGGDAATALAYGTAPTGPSALLTGDVLALQQHIAPLRDVRILDAREHGTTADVGYSYVLGFADGDQPVRGTVHLVRASGEWTLATTSVRTTVVIDQAADRFTFAGSTLPSGPVLLFPGALPVVFDSPYLGLDPQSSAVALGGTRTTDVSVRVTPRGRAALLTQLGRVVRSCLRGDAPDPACPEPSGRGVPGSLVGHLAAPIASHVDVLVTSEASGRVSVSGSVRVRGSYRALSYDNVVRTVRGDVAVRVDATAYPVAPLRLRLATSP